MSIKQRFVVLIFVVLACVIALPWWRGQGHEAVMDRSAPAESTASSKLVAPQSAANQTLSNGGTDTALQPPPTRKPSAELRSTFETLNNNDIEFYGRAVDQFGEPVAGAEVKGTVIVNTGTSGGEMPKTTATDAEGYFQFGGFKGQDLGIVIAKDGYEYRRHSSSFSYSYFEADHKRHIPDPRNPVVFILWRKQGAEPLVNYNKTFWEVPADGSPIRIDLANGKIGGANADLVISLERTPLKMRFGERGYQWKVSLDIVGGGLIEAGERDYYNVAPEAGYKPRFEYVQEAQSLREAQEGQIMWSWQDSVSKDLFIKSLNGTRYARVKIRAQAGGRGDSDTIGSVGLSVWLNPNGSRNLEYDPAKAITPGTIRQER